MHWKSMGWAVAALMIGLMAGSGFQPKADKVGTVDLGTVFTKSKLYAENNRALDAAQKKREEMLEFLGTYSVFSEEQVVRFKTLALKDAPTPAEKQEFEKLKSDVIETDKKLKALQVKANPTPEELKTLQELSRRRQTLQGVGARWASEFDRELNAMQQEMHDKTLAKVRTTVKEVGTKQGFSAVFASEIAPYGANDLTEDTLKAINSR